MDLYALFLDLRESVSNVFLVNAQYNFLNPLKYASIEVGYQVFRVCFMKMYGCLL